MTDAKQTVWREFCRKLEAIGVDPYAPDFPVDDPRHEQVVAIVAEYQAATTHKLGLTPPKKPTAPTKATAAKSGKRSDASFNRA